MQLNHWREVFDQLQVRVATFTIDKPVKAVKFSDEFEIAYPILWDERSRVANSINVRNRDYKPGQQAYGVPHPGVVYIAPDGTVLGKEARRGFRKRPEMREIAKMVIHAQKAQGWDPPAQINTDE